MAVTSHDVAREAGVSQSTVSRALNGDPRISEKTRLRVAEVAQRLAYAPSAPARSLITNRTLTAGLVVGDINNPFYAELIDALYNEFTLNGYRMLLFQERAGVEAGHDLIPLLLGRTLDGVILTTGKLTSHPVEVLVERRLPIVLLNRYVDGLDADRVTADNAGGGELAGRHLATLGHTRIAMITGPEDSSTSRDRESGFRAGLKRSGLSLDETFRRVGTYSYESGYDQCLKLLDLETPPTAVFCANDVIALGALNAARRKGTHVPRQLSIVGFDDLEMSGWETFDLTTVHQPIPLMAEAATRMLVDRIERHPGPSRHQVFPTSLVERTTSAPPTP